MSSLRMMYITQKGFQEKNVLWRSEWLELEADNSFGTQRNTRNSVFCGRNMSPCAVIVVAIGWNGVYSVSFLPNPVSYNTVE